MRYGWNKCMSIGLLLVALPCLYSWRQAVGQVDQGAITGVVQDTSGAAIPEAQVTLTSDDTGLELKTQSDRSGIYIFSPSAAIAGCRC